MAHDFSIKFDGIEVFDNGETYACYFGYNNAVTYRAFNAMEFNNGCSGSNGGKTVTQQQAEKGINQILKEDADVYGSADSEKFNKHLYRFLQVIKESPEETKFYIHYS